MTPQHHARTVPVITEQWWDVFFDSGLVDAAQRLERAVAEVVEAAVSSVLGDVGRRVFAALDEVVEVRGAVATAFAGLGRFASPQRQQGAAVVFDRWEEALYGFVRDAVDAALEGLTERSWREVWRYTETRDALVAELGALVSTPREDEPLLETVLGLPESVIKAGDGLTVAARVAAAWARQPDTLDDRLRVALPHLLDPSVPLTSEVRLHLTGLLLREHPLPAHAAAVAARDLVLDALAADEERV